MNGRRVDERSEIHRRFWWTTLRLSTLSQPRFSGFDAVAIGPRRSGDPPQRVADPRRMRMELRRRSCFSGTDTVIDLSERGAQPMESA